MQNETQAMTADELAQGYKALHKTLDETTRVLQKEKRHKMLWKALAIVLVCIVLYAKKSTVTWLPTADSQQMCVVMSDWWGLKVQAFYPVWRQPTGETGDYSGQWCVKHPNGTWQVFYDGHGKRPKYAYPVIKYNTYF